MAVADIKPIDVGFAKLRFGERISITMTDGKVFEGVFDDFIGEDDSMHDAEYICIDEGPSGVPARGLALDRIRSIEFVR